MLLLSVHVNRQLAVFFKFRDHIWFIWSGLSSSDESVSTSEILISLPMLLVSISSISDGFLNLKIFKFLNFKFAVIVVRIKQRIPFIRHCLQQRARLFIHFHSYILELCVTKYRKQKYHMTEKSFLKMNFIGSPFELSKNLTNRSHFNTTRLNGKIRHWE